MKSIAILIIPLIALQYTAISARVANHQQQRAHVVKLHGCHHAVADLVLLADTLPGDVGGLAAAAAAAVDGAVLLPEKPALGGPHSGDQSGRWHCVAQTWLPPRYVECAACATEHPIVEHSSAEVSSEVVPPVDEGWNLQPFALTA